MAFVFRDFEEELEKEVYKEKRTKPRSRADSLIKKLQKPTSYRLWREEKLITQTPKKTIKWLIGFLGLIFLISLGSFGYFYYLRLINQPRISLQVIGPKEVKTLEVQKFQIIFENQSLQNLKDLFLKIELSPGINFEDSPENNLQLSLGDIGPKQAINKGINLIFIGKEGEIKKFNITVSYKPENLKERIETTREIDVVIKQKGVKIFVQAPEKIFINEPFSFGVQFTNLTANEIKLSAELGKEEFFKIISSSLPFSRSEEKSWSEIYLPANGSKTIMLIAKFLNYPMKRPIIKIKATAQVSGRTLPLEDKLITFNLVEQPVKLTISAPSLAKAVKLNSWIDLKISWANDSNSYLKNVKIKVKLNEMVDDRNLYTKGIYHKDERTIIWDSQVIPQLAVLEPKEKGEDHFRIKLIPEFPLTATQTKNFNLEIKGELETPTIPEEVSSLEETYKVSFDFVKPVIGKIMFDQKIHYLSGPFPLKANQSTLLKVVWEIKTLGEDFDNVFIKTKLAPGVKPTFQFNENIEKEKFHYSETGEIIYSLEKLPANLGFNSPPLELAFEIVITPSAHLIGKSAPVISTTELTAQGSHSKNNFYLNIREVDTRSIIEVGSDTSKGLIQP